MEIDGKGVNATPVSATKVSPANSPAESDSQRISDRISDRGSDSVALSVRSDSSLQESRSSGDYSSKLKITRVAEKLQPMSSLKNKADARLKQFGSEHDAIESVSELKLDDDRKDMIEIAKLRVNSGFYDRPDVIDEIARRIIEGF